MLMEQNFRFTYSRENFLFTPAQQFYFLYWYSDFKFARVRDSCYFPVVSLENKNEETSHERLACSKRNKIVHPLCYKNIFNKTYVNNADFGDKKRKIKEREISALLEEFVYSLTGIIQLFFSDAQLVEKQNVRMSLRNNGRKWNA